MMIHMDALNMNSLILIYISKIYKDFSFTGQYKILGSTETIPLDHQSFLLRGCSLRNTKWIVGLVTYTGHDTKIMLNSVNGRAKKSNLEIQMNFQIIMIFFFQLILCILSASISIAW
jgi:phospholipid-transporting ATPase